MNWYTLASTLVPVTTTRANYLLAEHAGSGTCECVSETQAGRFLLKNVILVSKCSEEMWFVKNGSIVYFGDYEATESVILLPLASTHSAPVS